MDTDLSREDMSLQGGKDRLDVVLPVYNEAGSIEQVIREIYAELSPRFEMRLIICEDGSSDGTKEILIKLSKSYPIRLIMSPERKNYSRAVTDGIMAAEAPYILILDADGQCDPKDFWNFWPCIDRYDLVIGWRIKRSDSTLRLLMSRSFKALYDSLFHVPIHDPSCPYVLTTKRVTAVLSAHLGLLRWGFWWEFIARAYRHGFSIHEVPVNYCNRISGDTRVFSLRKIPFIAVTHVLGLLKIWYETRASKSA